MQTHGFANQDITGRELARQRCGGCHATGASDISPRKDAPPLRNLYGRYATDDLRRAFLNGIHVGHRDMPTVRLGRSELEALLGYLASIDPCTRPSTDTESMRSCFAPL